MGRSTQLEPQLFSGYTHPTMRADGANLWLGYSWPLVQTYPIGSTVGTVEIHLASSTTLQGANSGMRWPADPVTVTISRRPTAFFSTGTR
jgi:hypothetical protein